MPPSITILVVDDEQRLRDLVRGYLQREGYMVMAADDGVPPTWNREGHRLRPDDVVRKEGHGVYNHGIAAAHGDAAGWTARTGSTDRSGGLRFTDD